MAKYRAGDEVVFGRGKVNREAEGITIGRIYEVVERDGEVCFFDDDKDVRQLPLGPYSTYKVTKIVK